jgi:hypothetical protein
VAWSGEPAPAPAPPDRDPEAAELHPAAEPERVVHAERGPDGGVVEIVAGPGGTREVRRDPIGRLLGARPVQLPDERGSGKVSRERAVDAQGWIVERLRDAAGRVVDERLRGHVVQLAVRSARRAPDGSVVQVVADGDGELEVVRDAVGRFLRAAVIEPTRRGASSAPPGAEQR